MSQHAALWHLIRGICIGVARGRGLGGLGPLELVQKKISIVNCAHTICSLTDITLFSFYLNKTDRLL